MKPSSLKDHAWLKPSELIVDQEVQRAFDQVHAAKIGKVYDPLLFGLGHASVREDGQHYCLDGQHRIAAAIVAKLGDVPVLFRVYRGLDKAGEADLFRKLNANKKSVNALDDFRLAVVAGHPIHCDVQRIVESFGLQVAPYQRAGGIMAVVALLNIYQGKVAVKSTGPAKASGLPQGQLLSRTLHILTTAWGKDRNAYDGVLLRGVAALLHKHGTAVDAQRLAKVLAKGGSPIHAIGQIKSLQDFANKTAIPASVEWLEGLYNKGHRNGPKLGPVGA